MKKILPKIINNDQNGFLKDRLHKYGTNPWPPVIHWLRKSLRYDRMVFYWENIEYFNFGTSLVTWIKLFYTDISSCVQNNGWSSDFFTLSRGVRQGCLLSPYLFILCAEVLGNAIRRDEGIRGIKISGAECKLSQYADDTTMILDGSELSFSRTLYLLDIYFRTFLDWKLITRKPKPSG